MLPSKGTIKNCISAKLNELSFTVLEIEESFFLDSHTNVLDCFWENNTWERKSAHSHHRKWYISSGISVLHVWDEVMSQSTFSFFSVSGSSWKMKLRWPTPTFFSLMQLKDSLSTHFFFTENIDCRDKSQQNWNKIPICHSFNSIIFCHREKNANFWSIAFEMSLGMCVFSYLLPKNHHVMNFWQYE